MNVNILFTSVGRRVELLRAFRRAYQELGISGNIVALDIDPLAPALHVADRPYLVPRLDEDRFVSDLFEIIKKERISAVFPLIDPDIPRLAEHRQMMESSGVRAAVVAPDAAAIVGDKWATYEFLRGLGLPTPRTWLPDQVVASALTYPVIVKPRSGSASQHVYNVKDARELEFFLDYVPNPLVQELASGPEITNDVICDFDSHLLSVVSRQRIRVHGGEVIVGKTMFDGEIAHDCASIARALPAVGPITVQCMMQGDKHLFTEINARFGGGVPLGIAAGADSPRWLLASLAGLEVDIPEIGDYQFPLYFTRFHDSTFLNETQYAEFACRHLRP